MTSVMFCSFYLKYIYIYICVIRIFTATHPLYPNRNLTGGRP